jgi:hypothetical protein
MNILFATIINIISYFSYHKQSKFYLVEKDFDENTYGIKPVYIAENGRYIYDQNNNMII